MNWVVLSYSLPSKSRSSPRVTLWRRLRRVGAISPTGSLYVLPARNECIEAFQWLAQEIQQTDGQAVIIHVDRFEGLTDQQLIALFHEVRKEEYAGLEADMKELEQSLREGMEPEQHSRMCEALAKLQRQYADIVRIDYFKCPEGSRVRIRLEKLAQTLLPEAVSDPEVKPVFLDEYKGKTWVTRPQPHVDRMACIWLIRRFIDPDAVVRYSFEAQPDEISFDMNEATFGHTGNLCTFETMMRAFNLQSPGLPVMAEIVHEIDLRDERYFHPEATGIDTVLQGWLLLNIADAELESRGIVFFEGLFETLSAREQSGT